MPPKLLRILCFGDSLTSGYHSWGTDSRPYSIMLQDHLEAALPGTKIEVTTKGVPGDRASGPLFLKRLERVCREKTFDWAIILGGTNDLATPASPESIFAALQSAWDVLLVKNTKVLAMTVPECRVRVRWLDASRAEVNGLILAHDERNFYPFDLMSKIPYHSLPEELRQRFWDDGLHLTADGYDWMGNHITEALLDIISREDEAQEESGSPDNISQGYIVVRKKDLH